MTDGLTIRSWRQHNRRILKDVTRNRAKRGIPIGLPLSLERVVLATRLDDDFAQFAELVGGRHAETFFVRTLQYAAEHDGRHGRISVSRDNFGAVVLTARWDIVSRRDGQKCFDALLASRICVPFVRGQDCGPDCDCRSSSSADKSRDVLHPPSFAPPTSSSGSGDSRAFGDVAGALAQRFGARPERRPRSTMNAEDQRRIAAEWAADEKRRKSEPQVGKGAQTDGE